MMTNHSTRTTRLTAHLVSAGINVSGGTESDGHFDGEVTLNKQWHVQVSPNDYALVRVRNGLFTFMPPVRSVKALVAEIKKHVR